MLGSRRNTRILLLVLAFGVASVLIEGRTVIWDWCRLETVKTYHLDGSPWQRYSKIRWGENAGVYHGPWTAWHPNRQRSIEGIRHNGTWHGIVRGWDDKGRVLFVREYDHGELTRRPGLNAR